MAEEPVEPAGVVVDPRKEYVVCTNSVIAPSLPGDKPKPTSCCSVVKLTAAELATKRSLALVAYESGIAALTAKGPGITLASEETSAGFQSEKT